eukprot:TRINITY_DN18663_c0_g1_i4.p1 TRINITY_DN18663_c0_g1~~TRINITY_DN18663_c0_g1_i4.p1  ORF type:complete len:230 (+),score=69.93 TRINITY_DN18663_c0_g1_i4:61-750(+)
MSAAQCFSGDPVAAINAATNDPGLFHFKELLDLPEVQELGAVNPALRTLEIFCFKTIHDYTAAGLPALNATQTEKLRLLTFVSLCGQGKVVSYDSITEETGVGNVRELEDLVIATLDLGLVEGKLFHEEKEFHVKTTVGRDVHPSEYQGLLDKLVAWQAHSHGVVASMDEHVQSGIKRHQDKKAAEAEREAELAKLKTEVIEDMKNQKDKGSMQFIRSRQRGRQGHFRR